MSLRINQNTTALNAHRNLVNANERVSKSLERLSSGLRINSAGDGAAAMMASEQLRAQIASIDQAIRNTESTTAMVQTAEGALSEANNTLVEMRQLAIQSANEGSNDAVMLAANQASIKNMLESIDRIGQFTQFGQKKLLDGSSGVSGLAIGEGLEYVSAVRETKGSGEKGYEVKVMELATKANIMGTTPLTKELIAQGESLYVSEGGKTATYVTKETDTVDAAIAGFANAAKKAGLNVSIANAGDGRITIEHNLYGSQHTFNAGSSTAGVISTEAGSFVAANKGKDIRGTINGEPTTGMGINMTGIKGNPTTDGLTASFQTKDPNFTESEEGAVVGRVNVSQDAMTFQIGPNQGQKVNIAMQNVSSGALARGIENESGFQSLKDVDVTTTQGALDTMTLVDKAINDVIAVRAELGAFQNHTLEINAANMRVAKENMVAAESTIRDTDMAEEMAEFVKNDLIMQSSAAMLAQANQIPQKVMRLLE
jgi:flagellin